MKDYFVSLCNNDLTKLKFLVILSLIITLIDMCIKFWSCLTKKPAIVIVVYLHTIIILFTYLGWIFNNKYILVFYLLFLAGIMIQWALNDWRCFVTNIENNVCEFENYQYSDYFYRIFDKSLAPIMAYMVRILVIIIVIYKLLFY